MSGQRETDGALCDCGHRVKWHHDERGCGYLGFAPLQRCDCRLNSDAAVEQIIADRVSAVLDDLDARCCRAEFNLSDLASAHPLIADRLESKRQGVALVRDYIRAAIPTTPPVERGP